MDNITSAGKQKLPGSSLFREKAMLKSAVDKGRNTSLSNDMP
jgi:hypothetical protein